MPIRVLAVGLSVLFGGGSWLALIWPLVSGAGGVRIGVPAFFSGTALLLVLVVFVASRSGTCNAPCPTKGGGPCDNNVDNKALFDHRCWIKKHSIWCLDEQYDDEIPTWYQEWWCRLQLENMVNPSLIAGSIVIVPGLFDLIRLGVA
jgi:hypothetical protein